MNIRSLFSSFSRKAIFVVAIVLLVPILWLAFFGNDKPTHSEKIIVKQMSLSQEVSVSGQVKATQAVDLGFELSGKVADVLVKVGDRVQAGQELVVLENADLKAKILQAKSGVQAAQAEYQAKEASVQSSIAEVASANAGIDNERAQLAQYQSALEESQEQLKETKKGTRPEEISNARIAVKNAENEVTDLEKNFENISLKADQDLISLLEEGEKVSQEASSKANKVLRESLLEVIYSLPDSTYKRCEAKILGTTNLDRAACEDALRAVSVFSKSFDSMKLNAKNVQSSLSDAADMLQKLRLLVNAALSLADGAIAPDLYGSYGYSEQEIILLKAPITSALNDTESIIQKVSSVLQSIGTQLVINQSSLDSAENTLNRAKDALQKAQGDLDLKLAGSTPEKIASQEAKVRQAEANLVAQEARIRQAETAPSAQKSRIALAKANRSAQFARINQEKAGLQNAIAQLKKTIITAPFAGVITRQDTDPGEILPANASVVSLMSDAEFEIEAFVPEIDIAKVKLDDVAKVTLDAYGSDELFPASVVLIDPAETIVDQVTNYRVTFKFSREDARIRSGMTANIILKTASWENVLAVPEYAIIRKNGNTLVSILEKDIDYSSPKDVSVTLGGLSTDGFRIVTGGLKEGDVILYNFNE